MAQDKTIINGHTLIEWYDAAKQGGKAIDLDTNWAVPEIDEWFRLRLKCQTDLFWFAKEIFHLDLVDNYICPNHFAGEPHGMSPVSDEKCYRCGSNMVPCQGIPPGISIHREICNFFVHKNPEIAIPVQDTLKERLLMVPRGCFKSSIDEIDCIQWIIAFPNIRLALFTATDGLGVKFVENVRKRFVCQEDENTKKRSFTRFQLLFPEHVISPKAKQPEEQFTTPARTNSAIGEPSLHALSLGMATSGFHYEVGKFDDCVSNSNSGPGSTQERRDTVGEQIRLARAVIEPFGYRDHIGTPYDERDAYAHQIETTPADEIRVLIKPALEVKKDLRATPEDELTEQDYNLLFPIDAAGTPRLTYRVLMGLKHSDPKVYACQYLCRPSASRLVKFTEQMIRARMIQDEGLPQVIDCEIKTTWDTAWSTEQGSDYSVGTVALYDKLSRVFILEIVRGRFSQAELPYTIAKLAAKWNSQIIGIEGIPGVEAAYRDKIIDCLRRLGYSCPLEFFPVDRSKNAKELRAEMLEGLLISGHLYFSMHIVIMDDLVREFVRFKPHAKRKDDIIDSIAHACRYRLPEELPQSMEEHMSALFEIAHQRAAEDRVFSPSNPDGTPKENYNEDPFGHWTPIRGIKQPDMTQQMIAEPLSMEYFETPQGRMPIACPFCGMPKNNCYCK